MKMLPVMMMLIGCLCSGREAGELYQWAEWAARRSHPQAARLYQRVLDQPISPALLKARAARRLAQLALEDNDPEAALRWTAVSAQWAKDQLLPDDGPVPGYGAPKPPRLPASKRADDESVRYKLGTIIIPKISFDKASIEDVFGFLADQSRQLDIEGEGVNFILYLDDHPAAEDKPPAEKKGFDFGGEANSPAPASAIAPAGPPTVTMDFDNIPLYEAIRYICQGAGLHYQIERYGVIVADPNKPLHPMELQVYSIDPAYLSPTDPGPSVQTFFEDLGVDFPTGSHARQGPEPGQLIIWNTPQNQAAVKELLTGCHLFFQLQLDLRVLETPAGSESWPHLGRLLAQEHRWLAKQSLVGLSGTTFHCEQAEGMCFTANPMIASDGYSIRFDLDWSWKTPEGDTLLYRGSSLLWDGESLMFPLEQLDGRERFLLVTVILINPAGLPIRPHTWPPPVPDVQKEQAPNE